MCRLLSKVKKCGISPAGLVTVLLVFSSAATASGEKFLIPNDAQSALSLKGRGSFYVGGESVKQSFTEMGSQRAADTATVNQMYVEYMRPQNEKGLPYILVHGAGQSGSAWDTTPDGRMGWYEYLVRRGHSVYVVDQVGRARSGFNQALINNVAGGKEKPSSLKPIIRPGDLHALWINMRLGPEAGVPYKDTQFPVLAFNALSKMGIPDLSASLPSPNPTYSNLSMLADKLKGAVLVGHSQSGSFPLDTALMNPAAVKGMLLVEPGTCKNDQITDEQLKILSPVPLIVIFGDHLSASTELPGKATTWFERKDECSKLVSRLNRAGGHAAMFYLPSMGIKGNSHMLMQDKNNILIADKMLAWFDKHM